MKHRTWYLNVYIWHIARNIMNINTNGKNKCLREKLKLTCHYSSFAHLNQLRHICVFSKESKDLLLKNLYSERTSPSSSPISRHCDNLFEALIVCYFFYSYPLILHLPWVLTEQPELFSLSESGYVIQDHIYYILEQEPTRWSTVFPPLPLHLTSDLVPMLSLHFETVTSVFNESFEFTILLLSWDFCK